MLIPPPVKDPNAGSPVPQAGGAAKKVSHSEFTGPGSAVALGAV